MHYESQVPEDKQAEEECPRSSGEEFVNEDLRVAWQVAQYLIQGL